MAHVRGGSLPSHRTKKHSKLDEEAIKTVAERGNATAMQHEGKSQMGDRHVVLA